MRRAILLATLIATLSVAVPAMGQDAVQDAYGGEVTTVDRGQLPFTGLELVVVGLVGVGLVGAGLTARRLTSTAPGTPPDDAL